MDVKILAVALLRRLGGDVTISDAELATAAACDFTLSPKEDAVSCIAIDARGVPSPLRMMEECTPILAS